MMLLDNQAIVVTGAAQGIGRSIAICSAKEGARVCITDISMDRLQVTAGLLDEIGADYLAMRL